MMTGVALKKRIPCKSDGCDLPAVCKGFCKKHYDKQRHKSERYKEQHYERKVRRRCLQRGVYVEKVYRKVVWARDKEICGLCGEKVDCSLRAPDPHSPSIDHIVPISKGGVHSYENVQLAHLGCNVGKGSRSVRPVAYRGARIVYIKAQPKKIG